MVAFRKLKLSIRKSKKNNTCCKGKTKLNEIADLVKIRFRYKKEIIKKEISPFVVRKKLKEFLESSASKKSTYLILLRRREQVKAS